MKIYFVKSSIFGNVLHFSVNGQGVANVAKTPNGSYYLNMDHFKEPLKLTDKIKMIDTIKLIKKECSKIKRLTK